MEKREGFKRVVEGINQLEQQLMSIVEEGKKNDKHGAEVKEELENCFARYEESLAARKQALLRELNEKITAQKKAEVDAQEELSKAIEARKKLLEAGSSLYNTDINIADHVWKGVTILQWPHVSVGRVQLDPYGYGAFLELIQVLGKDVLLYNKPSLKRTLENSGESAAKKTALAEDKVQQKQCDNSIAKEITTLAGSSEGFADGDGDHAKFSNPLGICWNPHDECLYLCDHSNDAIRRITLQGQVSTLARKGLLSLPVGIAMHYRTNTFFVINHGSHSVCKITASGLMSVHAGSGKAGSQDGLGASACLNYPYGIAIDQQTDTIYVSDSHSIRKITLQGEVSTLAGSADAGDANGNGNGARFKVPAGLWFDEKHQSLLVCDRWNNKLKRVSLKGDVLTVVCVIPWPNFVTIANSAILVSTYYGKIYRVTEAGEASVLQQHGEGEETKECQFNNNYGLYGLVLDEATNTCFVVEWGDHHVIKKITF